ncbi:hypothetical protein GCM10025868_28480 [Angustibacter aerolatus]|uniref:Uncharacterized protein n=1 Tax=Angustibacter aerolatus TaxID=1162965 RepID=A0ABQ6JHC2_9ACTN|nr:hypothetical protein GCM10025868_28480 [Angustibacter aerolatus]
MPPTGVFRLVADVRHEVAAHLLEPPSLGAVLDEHQQVAAHQRRDPGVHDEPAAAERAAGRLELALAHLAVATHLPGHLAQARGG